MAAQINESKKSNQHPSDINLETMYGTVNNSLNGLRKMISENPKVVLGVAFGVGLLVGLIAGGKKDSTEKQDA